MFHSKHAAWRTKLRSKGCLGGKKKTAWAWFPFCELGQKGDTQTGSLCRLCVVGAV